MKKQLIIGYGNSTRSDDGAGVRVAEKLAERKIPGVEVRTMQQLHIELAEELTHYEAVIFVDASENVSRAEITKVEAVPASAAHSSHHLGPAVLASLSKTLYDREPQFFCCQVPAENLDFGESFSRSAERGVHDAEQLILKTIEEFHHA